eukprot:CAMPEP_0174244776 /NCGR_PEP_ID=MMETSP0417-20130205/36604_1 /TAXON_ID=242541 /ORGANISM="Mayorella sp, Strain BSH-02190019" /LENGTH=360 /DNA_ID=CAMNT_0015324499 /DNA_START=69 /DNA_END=1147 /DNA_ORIENTATION=-
MASQQQQPTPTPEQQRLLQQQRLQQQQQLMRLPPAVRFIRMLESVLPADKRVLLKQIVDQRKAAQITHAETMQRVYLLAGKDLTDRIMKQIKYQDKQTFIQQTWANMPHHLKERLMQADPTKRSDYVLRYGLSLQKHQQQERERQSSQSGGSTTSSSMPGDPQNAHEESLPRSTPREPSLDTIQLLARLDDVGREIDEEGEAHAALQRTPAMQPLGLQTPEPEPTVMTIQEMMDEVAQKNELSIADKKLYEFMELALQEHLSNLVDDLISASKQRLKQACFFPTVASDSPADSSTHMLSKRTRRQYTIHDSNSMLTQLHRLNKLETLNAAERAQQRLLRKRLRAAEPTRFMPSGISLEPV